MNSNITIEYITNRSFVQFYNIIYRSFFCDIIIDICVKVVYNEYLLKKKFEKKMCRPYVLEVDINSDLNRYVKSCDCGTIQTFALIVECSF